jgi:hypothetical protein
MTSIPATGDGSQPREWSISNRTLILSAGSRRVLAVLNGHDPLLLPPGSVLQFDDPPGELVVTGIRIVAGDGGGIVCLEAEPEPGHRRVSAASGRPRERPGHLRPVPTQTLWRSTTRSGNG